MRELESEKFRISKSVIKLILAAARDAYPDEFVALLGGKRNLINEIIVLPFSSSGFGAILRTEVLPIGIRVMGTAHSHPSESLEPSEQDLEVFSRFGKVHVIVAYPFNENSWKCYDKHGNPIDIELVEE